MADQDPLAKWRRGGSQPAQSPVIEPEPASTAKPDDSYGYVAFTGMDRGVGEFISVVRASGLVRRFSYNGLVEIADDGDFGTQLALVFNFGPVVFIYGRNLSGLALGLCFRRIEKITEYDAKRWPELKDKSAPIIERIDIEVKGMADAIAAVEHGEEKAAPKRRQA
jgi:hypothetical protein